MDYKNLSLEGSTGRIYEYSTEQKEGFEPFTNSKGNTQYRKYYTSIDGRISSIDIKTPNYKNAVEQFNIRIVKDGVCSTLSFPSRYQGKPDFSGNTRAMLSALKGYEPGEEISLTVYRNGKYTNFYINYLNKPEVDGKRQSTGYIPFAEIPKGVPSEVAGKTVYDNTATTNFFYELLLNVKASLESQKEEYKAQAQPATTTSESGMVPNTEFESSVTLSDDDLPF